MKEKRKNKLGKEFDDIFVRIVGDCFQHDFLFSLESIKEIVVVLEDIRVYLSRTNISQNVFVFSTECGTNISQSYIYLWFY